MTRVIIAAAGTGGHIIPAMAVADYLLQHGHEVSWCGTNGALEKRLLKDKYSFHALTIKGLRAKGWRGWLMAPIRLVKSLAQALAVIKQVQPDVVLAMGGYICGPVGLAAWLKRIPLIVHEQNARAGLTNRILARLAKHIYCAFPQTFKKYYKKTTVIGNPIRSSILDIKDPLQRLEKHHGALRLLILGGSQGAMSINQACVAAWQQLSLEQRPDIWHQTGARDYQATLSKYQAVGIAAKVDPFIDDINQAYDWADLVICRSGAMTVSELATIGLASILIPYPHAVDNHQYFNAKFLVDLSAAYMIEDKALTAQTLLLLLQKLLDNRSLLLDMAQQAKQASQLDATNRLADACVQYGLTFQSV